MGVPGRQEGVSRVDDPTVARAEWLGRLNALAAQVQGWAEDSGWRTRLVSKPTRDSLLGRFEVPLLLMERNGVEVALNPVSPFVPGADGAVDLYVVPAYDEVASLYLAGDDWTVHYVFPEADAAGIREPLALPLAQETITRVLEAMAVGAV